MASKKALKRLVMRLKIARKNLDRRDHKLPPLVLRRKDGRQEIIRNVADAVRFSGPELEAERAADPRKQ